MDYQKRRTFVNRVLVNTEVDPGIWKENSFWLKWFVNLQNNDESPHALQEKLTHWQKYTIWCELFQDEVGNVVTVDDFVFNEINGFNVDDMSTWWIHIKYHVRHPFHFKPNFLVVLSQSNIK